MAVKDGWVKTLIWLVVGAVVTILIEKFAEQILPADLAWLALPFKWLWNVVEFVWRLVSFTVPFPLSLLLLAAASVCYIGVRIWLEQRTIPAALFDITRYEERIISALAEAELSRLSVQMASLVTGMNAVRVEDTMRKLIGRGFVRVERDEFGEQVYALTEQGKNDALKAHLV